MFARIALIKQSEIVFPHIKLEVRTVYELENFQLADIYKSVG